MIKAHASIEWHRYRDVVVSFYIAEDVGDHSRQISNSWPTGCAQHNNGNPSLCQILLIAEVLISGDQDIKTMTLYLLQQLSVRQIAPARRAPAVV